VAEPELSFAGLLRQLRGEARLTQEELAEAAGLSPRSVSDLERGITRTAHKDTALLLAGALGLAEPVRALFVLAARGKGPAADVLAAREAAAPGAFAAAAVRALPRDIAAFTGRQTELAQLIATLASTAVNGEVVGIHAIDGMAGVGKTTFAVHAAHQLARAFPDGQFFLPLHAHTAGQRPVDPADALASLLLTAGVPAAQIPPGLQARAGRWRDFVAGKKILLVLDDAAGHEQVAPLLPGTAGSLVLVTSRRRLTALQDSTVISLDVLPAGEAAALLARLAGRADLASRTGPAGEITRLCGYLPLAIGMLASQLRHHPAWSAAGLAAELAAAKDRLALMRAEDLSVAAVFGLSYRELTAGPQRLFRRLGLVPGPSFDAYAAAALDGTSLAAARRHLDGLYDQHLLTEPAAGRYRLHDLLREHARALAAADPDESAAATGRLLDYYAHTAADADRHLAPWAVHHHRPPPPGCPPSHAPDLSTPGRAAAWLENERPNLHAVVDYAATCGHAQHAVRIPAAMSGFLHAQGHWEQSAALQQTALTAARQAEDPAGEAATLAQLGALQREMGDYPAAAVGLAKAAALYCDLGDLPGQGAALDQLGFVHSLTGDYAAAAASHRLALRLARDAGDRLAEAWALNSLGLVQQLTGDYPAAVASHQRAVALFAATGHRYGEADALNNLGVSQQLIGDYPAAAACQQQALALFEAGNRLGRAWALNDLGLVQQLTGDYTAAAAAHEQALELFGELGNRLGQAEALNNLGQLATRTANTRRAREQHAQALNIARDLGAPLEEAHALEGIGQAHIQDGNLGEGGAHLRQALTIYQRIRSPSAHRVQQTLRQYALKPAPPPSHH
jgi:tetratricopeptide (TPR) repeat protein/transcriptional regulator with XRE-family HTH domain